MLTENELPFVAAWTERAVPNLSPRPPRLGVFITIVARSPGRGTLVRAASPLMAPLNLTTLPSRDRRERSLTLDVFESVDVRS